MRRVLAACFCLLLVSATPSFAQKQLRVVQQLFEAAAFEEALDALTKLQGIISEDDALAVEEYRILCLLALGHSERAEAAVEQLLKRHPDYVLSPRFSPRHREQFDAMRRRVLPAVIRSLYADGRASYVARKYEQAVARFSAVLNLLNQHDQDTEFAETRELASAFLELSTVALANGAAAGTSGVVSPAPASEVHGPERQSVSRTRTGEPPADALNTGVARPTIYDVRSTDVVPPTAVEATVPAVSAASRAAPGLFEIVVDETGRVESVTVRRSLDPENDKLVLTDARTWRFRPATRHGRPVKFRKLIEVYAVTLESPRR